MANLAIQEQQRAREQTLALAQPYTDIGRFTLPGLFRAAVAPIDYSGLPRPRLLEFGGGYSPTTAGEYTPRQYFAEEMVSKTPEGKFSGFSGAPINIPPITSPNQVTNAAQAFDLWSRTGTMTPGYEDAVSQAATATLQTNAPLPAGFFDRFAPVPQQGAQQPLFTMEQLQAGTAPKGTFNAGFLGAPTQQMAAASGVKPSQIRTMAAPAVMPDMQGRPVPPQAPTDFLGGFRAINPPGGPRFDGQGNIIAEVPQKAPRDTLVQGPGFGMTPAPTGGQLLPALPSVTPQPVGPLPGLRPEVTGLPGLAPIAGRLPGLAPVQGALPGVSYTAPTGLPALTPTQGIGLPGLNIVGPEQLPGLPTPVQPELPRISPIAQVGPALGPTAQITGALAPTAQMGPALGPVLPTDLPTIGANIQQDSLFQALKREAIGGIEASAAARGKLFSGTTPQAIAERVQNLALARAGDIQAQNIAARQQLMSEAQQQFGQQLAGRSLAGTEAERLFSQQAAAQGMAGTEAERLFAQQLAARQLGGTEAERAFAQQVQARQIAGAEGGQAFQQALALRELAGSEAARQFGQQLAARQQLMGEGGQVFGETVTARQLGSAEAQQAFAQQMALRQLAGAEVGDIFGRSLAARQLAGAETGDIFSRSLAAQQQAAALQGQTFGQSLAARQALLAQQQQQQQTAMALRSQLIGERGTLFGQELAARQALLGERIGEQERQYQQLFNIAQLGQSSAMGQAAAVQQAAGNIGDLLTQQGNAYAAGQIGAQNARAGMTQGLLQAGATLGGAMIIASDRRIKTDIVRIGAMDNGLPLYSFRYKGKPDLHMGVMAQDVEKVKPEAVVEINGIKHVNYGAL